jgi:hypothetical protein
VLAAVGIPAAAILAATARGLLGMAALSGLLGLGLIELLLGLVATLVHGSSIPVGTCPETTARRLIPHPYPMNL